MMTRLCALLLSALLFESSPRRRFSGSPCTRNGVGSVCQDGTCLESSQATCFGKQRGYYCSHSGPSICYPDLSLFSDVMTCTKVYDIESRLAELACDSKTKGESCQYTEVTSPEDNITIDLDSVCHNPYGPHNSPYGPNNTYGSYCLKPEYAACSGKTVGNSCSYSEGDYANSRQYDFVGEPIDDPCYKIPCRLEYAGGECSIDGEMFKCKGAQLANTVQLAELASSGRVRPACLLLAFLFAAIAAHSDS